MEWIFPAFMDGGILKARRGQSRWDSIWANVIMMMIDNFLIHEKFEIITGDSNTIMDE